MSSQSQKLITFCIPAYNSDSFLHFAIDSLIPFGNKIEVLIIDDGSKDKTGALADRYAAEHPDFIRAIHQPNRGHGGGINHGLELANGLYFKVLDSDDWVDEEALAQLLNRIEKEKAVPDLYLCDYQYWQGRGNRGQRISYAYLFPKGKNICTWNDLHIFRYSSNITLHSAMYKTSVLRQSGVHCPEHVSYEDNYFVYCPMPFVKVISYVPYALYQYLVGREGQSMENSTCIRKYNDYIIDGKLIFDSHRILDFRKTNKGLYRAMRHHLILNMVMIPVFARLNASPKALADLKEFFHHCKAKDPRMYRLVRYHFAVNALMFPGKAGAKTVKYSYRLSHLLVKFN